MTQKDTRKSGTIRVGDPVIVIKDGSKGRCTSRPGTKYFVNFGKDRKGEIYERSELKIDVLDENQTNLFEITEYEEDTENPENDTEEEAE